jgi:regulation of enolase protein 1 (concanavalin A-like superfamily)
VTSPNRSEDEALRSVPQSAGIVIPSLPMGFSWLRPPLDWSLDGGAPRIGAGPKTDWFADPAGGVPVLNAPALVGRPPDEDFTLLARVRIDAASTFDAGVLFVHGDDKTWAKHCLELSPQGQPMIVSVVTRGVSDDCNSQTVEGGEVWLRLARANGVFAFHVSRDGERWELVRFFALPVRDIPSASWPSLRRGKAAPRASAIWRTQTEDSPIRETAPEHADRV